jgi:hypothetical protein
VIEFLAITRWQPFEATKHYTGNEISRSIVESGAVAALPGYDTAVKHYGVIEHAWT